MKDNYNLLESLTFIYENSYLITGHQNKYAYINSCMDILAKKYCTLSIDRNKNLRIFVSSLWSEKQAHTELANCCYKKAARTLA